jgi:hypothetical protein
MTNLKKLLFGRGFVRPVVLGDKLITLRKYRPGAHDFHKGEIVWGEFEEGIALFLRITADTEVKTFRELTDAEAVEDGYRDTADAFRGLARFYPDIKPTDRCAVIRFEMY